MEHFIAYHSAQRMGYDYGSPGSLAFLSKKLGVLKKAIGNTVWVVQGAPNGKKTAYTLCGAYIAESIAPQSPSSNTYIIRGTQGMDFVPPVPLNELSWFPVLLRSQSNFSLGFNRLSDESVVLALSELQSGNGSPSSVPSLPDVDFAASVSEGGLRLVSHLRRERKRAVIEAKKAAVRGATGRLSCEVCGFDFSVPSTKPWSTSGIVVRPELCKYVQELYAIQCCSRTFRSTRTAYGSRLALPLGGRSHAAR
jgi:hypothetical protein